MLPDKRTVVSLVFNQICYLFQIKPSFERFS
jgi:hypothetical protein